MPRNKEALIRYRVINRCLVNGKVASLDKLKQECEYELGEQHIGKRTIQEDLKDMREDDRLGYNAPIKFDRYRNGYVYTDPDYSIDKIPLNEEELSALAFSATMLSQLSNVEIFASFTGAAQKIMDAINVHRLMEEESEYDFIQFEQVPFTKGSEYLQPIIDAIRNKLVIQLTYQAFQADQPKETLVHPYLLKEYKHRWYIIGLNDDEQKLKTYGLDRIKGVKVKGKQYIEKDFSPREYFKNTVGVIAPTDEPPEIMLSVKKPQAQYLVTQPLHESQKIAEDQQDKIIFKLKVHPTYELISILLGFGKDLKILKPKRLAKEIIQILENTLGQYD